MKINRVVTTILSGHDLEKIDFLLKRNPKLSVSGLIRRLIQVEYVKTSDGK